MRSTILFVFATAQLYGQLLVTLNDAPLPGFVTLPPAAPGEIKTAALTVLNTGSGSVSVAPLLSGAGFSLQSGVPFQLSPHQSQLVTIRFQASSPGGYSASLNINEWSALLRIAVNEELIPPPFPEPRITVEPGILMSGIQAKVSVIFDADPPADATGTLSLTTDTSDESIQFLPSTKASIPFEVHRGLRTAIFGSSNSTTLQTGATSGSIFLNAAVRGQQASASFAIPPAPIQLDSAIATATASKLELVLTGFDNTRTAGGMIYFTFYGKDDAALPDGLYSRADLGDSFKTLFAQSSAGGVFELRATFAITGAPSAITAVEAQIANSTASTKTGRISIQ